MYKSLGTENKFLNSIWMWCQNNTRLILYMGGVKISEDINPRYIWFGLSKNLVKPWAQQSSVIIFHSKMIFQTVLVKVKE